jgi:antitoxin component of MazEF toxin-antitoxin module
MIFYFMSRRKLVDKNIRKILKSGDSYAVTIPIEVMRELKWREKQKVVVKKYGSKVVIKDWKR